METKWSLDSIYTSVNSAEFKRDIDDFKRLTDELNTWAQQNMTEYGNPLEKLEAYINMKNQLMAYEKLELYLNLASSTNTADEELSKALDIVRRVASASARHEAVFSEFLKHVDDMAELIEKSSVLKEHGYFLTLQRERAEHILSPEEESIIANMKATGSSLWERQWQHISSNLTAELDGKELSLSEIRNMAYSGDASVRKAAYAAEIKAYDKIKDCAAFCMNGIKGEVISLCEMRGYSSPLDMTLEESRMDRGVLRAMFSAIEEALPKLRSYFLIKSAKLGNKGALPFYDLFAPLGSGRKFTLEQARDFVLECFYGFSRDLGDFALKAFENRWLDLMPAKGKVGGAYCESIHSLRESRILTNFGGGFDDVVTIAHELGHAFHNTRLFCLSELNSFYPMPIAETASTFCESIVINHMLSSATPEEREAVLETDLQGLTQCIVDIYSRFLFEDSVFESRKNGSLSASELCTLMTEAQKKAYGEGLEESTLHPYMWVCKPHYYDADFNYYNFPYAFGALLSKGLYAMYRERGSSFIELYDRLLAASSTDNMRNVAKIAGIDLGSKEFWLKGLEMICNEIDEFAK